ncbi:hypothetical protein [Alicyclobacillus fodiniaquatilis]|uniref:Uncharacterized protein n=1 Tax=Alicyclobacillus fodiniaquatilis TaxID=1661150 RepID=A0ABW4JQV0_9BACL
MHVLAISTVSHPDEFWGSLKKAYSRLPQGSMWLLAVASTDGTKAVNVIVHDSIYNIRNLFEEYVAPFGTTEYFEVDATNAVGLMNP